MQVYPELVALTRRRWFWGLVMLAGAAALVVVLSGESEDPLEAMRRDKDVRGLVRVRINGQDDDSTRAVVYLADVCTPQAIAALLEATRDPRGRVRGQAAISLGVASRRKHVDRMVEMLKDDTDPKARAAAAMVLGEVYACNQVPDLINAYATETEPAVYKSVQWSITRIMGMRHTVADKVPPDVERKMTALFYKDMWGSHGEAITRDHWEGKKR